MSPPSVPLNFIGPPRYRKSTGPQTPQVAYCKIIIMDSLMYSCGFIGPPVASRGALGAAGVERNVRQARPGGNEKTAYCAPHVGRCRLRWTAEGYFMRIFFYGLAFETPRVTVHLWSPWRSSALENRLFEMILQGLRGTPEQAPDEVQFHITEPKSW